VLAADLEMFTPSMSGRTMVDRYVRARSPASPEDRQAFQALSAAQFHLVKIVDREGPDLVQLRDLVTGESLLLLDERISSLAAGQPTAMRLCPLESGRHVLISPLFAMDELMLRRGHDIRPSWPPARDWSSMCSEPLPQCGPTRI